MLMLLLMGDPFLFRKILPILGDILVLIGDPGCGVSSLIGSREFLFLPTLMFKSPESFKSIVGSIVTFFDVGDVNDRTNLTLVV